MKRTKNYGCVAVIMMGLAISAEAATVRVTGGALFLGSKLTATNFILGSAATLTGSGEIRAPATLSGTVSPGTNTTDIGNLSFSNLVTFNSATFVCYAASDTSLDRISVTGTVSGSATVQMSRGAGVSPLRQIIIKGGAASDYHVFSVTPAAEWVLGEAGALDLVVSLGQAPSAPLGIAASDGTYVTQILIIWSAASGANGYQVWRNTLDSSSSAVLMGAAGQTNYGDFGAVAGVTYYYWVRGTNNLGAGSFSSSDSGWRASFSSGVSADYDGDRKADPVIYDEATGTWKVRLSGSGYAQLTTPAGWLGGPGYAAVSADYDGDRKADPAIYQESTGVWIILPSSLGYTPAYTLWQTLGGPGYSGIPADFDGDLKADPAIYERSQGDWQVLISSFGYYAVAAPLGWLGGSNYLAVAGIYNDDSSADPAVYGTTTGDWLFRFSSAYDPIQTYGNALGDGGTGYIPVPADYDGDGKTDPAVRSETGDEWRVLLSDSGYALQSFSIPFE
ncbi:MAG: fibronectin type III domain-containing protein [Lentisphaerae bacterium]|nr:fibronectin type III domain-containing protein [Lentisphaerota bacterium]